MWTGRDALQSSDIVELGIGFSSLSVDCSTCLINLNSIAKRKVLMNSLVISYEVLDDGGKEHVCQSLDAAIKGYGIWARITDLCWAIKTERSAVEVRDALRRLMRAGDRLFVVQTAHIAAWNNTMCRNDWLQENI